MAGKCCPDQLRHISLPWESRLKSQVAPEAVGLVSVFESLGHSQSPLVTE